MLCEQELQNILQECNRDRKKNEILICESILEIIQNPGYEFYISKEYYKYLCRCVCFLKTDFKLEIIRVYRFSFWNILALIISATFIYLFLMGGGYLLLVYLLSLIFINLNVLNPIYFPLPPKKLMYYPFRSNNEWLIHKHYLEKMMIKENCDLKIFRVKQTLFKKIYSCIFNTLLYPFSMLYCIFPERCKYLIQKRT